MQNPESESWWSTWLDMHGRDSDEERAFLGYLSQHSISSQADRDDLDAAYEAFKVFMAESQATMSADAGPPALPMEPVVPQSTMADPDVQRPVDDATHPRQMSSAGAPASPAPPVDEPPPRPEPPPEEPKVAPAVAPSVAPSVVPHGAPHVAPHGGHPVGPKPAPKADTPPPPKAPARSAKDHKA